MPMQLPTPLATSLARRFNPVPHSYTERDVSLYALAVGAAAGDASSSSNASSSNPSSELALVFDGAAGFAPLPTFPCTFPYFGVTAAVPFEEILPNFNPVSFSRFCFYFVFFCCLALSCAHSPSPSLSPTTLLDGSPSRRAVHLHSQALTPRRPSRDGASSRRH